MAVVRTKDLRAELVGAAVAMLATPQDVKVPSLRSIAKACAVAPSAVYWHFPSEADLREAVLDDQYGGLISALEAALDGPGEPRDILVRAGVAYVTWALEHPGSYQLLFEGQDDLPETRAERGPAVQDRVIDLVGQTGAAAPLESALLLWSLQHGIASLRIHKPDWPWGMSIEAAVLGAVEAIAHASEHDDRVAVHRP